MDPIKEKLLVNGPRNPINNEKLMVNGPKIPLIMIIIEQYCCKYFFYLFLYLRTLKVILPKAMPARRKRKMSLLEDVAIYCQIHWLHLTVALLRKKR